jgi:hypothetical protein
VVIRGKLLDVVVFNKSPTLKQFPLLKSTFDAVFNLLVSVTAEAESALAFEYLRLMDGDDDDDAGVGGTVKVSLVNVCFFSKN